MKRTAHVDFTPTPNLALVYSLLKGGECMADALEVSGLEVGTPAPPPRPPTIPPPSSVPPPTPVPPRPPMQAKSRTERRRAQRQRAKARKA